MIIWMRSKSVNVEFLRYYKLYAKQGVMHAHLLEYKKHHI